VEVAAGLAGAGVPVRYLNLDSWWYNKGADLGTKEWTPLPGLFPSGANFRRPIVNSLLGKTCVAEPEFPGAKSFSLMEPEKHQNIFLLYIISQRLRDEAKAVSIFLPGAASQHLDITEEISNIIFTKLYLIQFKAEISDFLMCINRCSGSGA
jgi:hypothetical protein